MDGIYIREGTFSVTYNQTAKILLFHNITISLAGGTCFKYTKVGLHKKDEELLKLIIAYLGWV